MKKLSHKIGFLVIVALLLQGCQPSYRKPTPPPPSRSAFQFYYQALDELQNGNLPQAIAHLDSAIHLQPGYSQFYCVKGRVYQLLEKPDSAISAYEQCLKYKSFHPTVWIRLGKLYAGQKNFTQAAIYLEKSIQQFPDSTQILLTLGVAYLHLHRYIQAKEALIRYLRAFPHDTLAWKYIGLTFFYRNDNAQALKWLEPYLQRYPQDTSALYASGVALFRLGKLDKGLSYLNRVYQLCPDSVSVFSYRARYFWNYGKKQKAWEQIHLGLAKDSSNVALLLLAAQYALQQNQPQEAKKYLQRAQQKNPNRWEVYKYLGMVAEAEKNLVTAANYYTLYLNHILQSDPEVSERLTRIQKQMSK